MTTILRSDVTLSAPPAGSLVLPNLGVSGILHRWHAEAASGLLNSQVTSVPDTVGTAHLTTTSGTVLLKEATNGRRYLDMGTVAGTNLVRSGTISQPYTAYTLAALYYWDALPSPVWSTVTTTAGMGINSSMNLLTGAYGVGTWNTGGGAASNTAPTPPAAAGWHTIFVGYDKTGNEMAALDGANVGRLQGHGTVDNIDQFAIRGNGTIHSRIVDAVFIDHMLSDAEIAALHTKLIAQVPA